MKKILLSFLLGASSIALNAQSISAARSAPIGSTVTVSGIITNGSELGVIRYLQDNTAGIAAYGGTASVAGFTAATKGDSVSITGVTKLYNNLLEIDPVTGYTIHATKPVPNSTIVTPSNFNESVEGQLISIQNCTFSSTGNFGTGSTNYTVTSNSQTFVLRVVNTATTITGTSIPSGTVNITGIASQFCSSPATGCTTGYQLLPRTIADITTFSGIKELTQSHALSVYPNPSSENISIVNQGLSNIKELIVTDFLGREVYRSSNEFNSVNTSGFVNGIYYLTITTNTNIYQAKFTVLR